MIIISTHLDLCFEKENYIDLIIKTLPHQHKGESGKYNWSHTLIFVQKYKVDNIISLIKIKIKINIIMLRLGGSPMIRERPSQV